MLEFLSKLFDTNDFPARWHCGNWSSGLGWLHILSDLAIFGAYAAIPTVLAVFLLRRKAMPYAPVMWLFVAFILACGIGHLIEASIFWNPVYRLSGLSKLITALVSWATVIALIPILPRLVDMTGENQALHRKVSEGQQEAIDLKERATILESENAHLEHFVELSVGREKRILELKRQVNELLIQAGQEPRYESALESEEADERIRQGV